MLNTVEELLNLSRKLGLQCDISENNVTFGETQKDIQREKVESQKIYFNDRDLFITNIFVLKYHMPCVIYDLADKSITEEEISKLVELDTSTFQITASIYTEDEYEFSSSKSIKIVDVTSGLGVSFELTPRELLKMLGITKRDLKKKFDMEEDEDGDIEYINMIKVADFIKSLNTADWTYVIVQMLLEN